MSKDSKFDRLHAAPLFARCDSKELKHLESIIDTVDVKKGLNSSAKADASTSRTSSSQVLPR